LTRSASTETLTAPVWCPICLHRILKTRSKSVPFFRRLKLLHCHWVGREDTLGSQCEFIVHGYCGCSFTGIRGTYFLCVWYSVPAVDLYIGVESLGTADFDMIFRSNFPSVNQKQLRIRWGAGTRLCGLRHSRRCFCCPHWVLPTARPLTCRDQRSKRKLRAEG
jgi:hypothetical protein